MFYKHFRLEISTDWNSAFKQQIYIKKFWHLFLEVVQNSVWNFFSEISPFVFLPWQHWGSRQFLNQLKIFSYSCQLSTILTSPALFRMCSREKFFIYLTSKMRNRDFDIVNFFIYYRDSISRNSCFFWNLCPIFFLVHVNYIYYNMFKRNILKFCIGSTV
jgi:hypothetical protein